MGCWGLVKPALHFGRAARNIDTTYLRLLRPLPQRVKCKVTTLQFVQPRLLPPAERTKSAETMTMAEFSILLGFTGHGHKAHRQKRLAGYSLGRFGNANELLIEATHRHDQMAADFKLFQ